MAENESTGTATRYESSSELKFSFGTITVSVGVAGDVSRPEEFCDYMLASATGISDVEALRRLQNGDRNNGGTKQMCTNEITFGAISIKLTLGFDLKSEVSNRTLNSIVAEINLLLWNAYGSFMGNKGGLGAKTHTAVLANIAQVLEMPAGQAALQNGHARSTHPGRSGQGYRQGQGQDRRASRPGRARSGQR